MLKVIIIGPAYPLRGGIANFNEALCRSMATAGHESSILSFTLQYPGFLFPGTTQFAESDAPPSDVKIETTINSINPVSWFKTVAHILKEKPDVIVIRYWLPFMAPCLGSIARMVKRKNKNIRIIAIADNIVPHESRPGDKAFTRYFVNSCDAFLVMSQSVKDDLLKFDKKKPVIVQPHPVYDIFGSPVSKSESRKKLGLQNDARVVLFFGFIRKYKGLDLLLHAFADERLKSEKIQLLVAGEFYEDKKPYIDLIKQLGIEDRVILHDHYIPKDDVKYYFGASDIVAQPYRDATQSGVTQIAYHFSKPMIVTNVGGLPEMVPNGVAGYVTSTDPKEIADAIADYFMNNREDELTKGVIATAKKFSWEEFVSKLLDLK